MMLTETNYADTIPDPVGGRVPDKLALTGSVGLLWTLSRVSAGGVGDDSIGMRMGAERYADGKKLIESCFERLEKQIMKELVLR